MRDAVAALVALVLFAIALLLMAALAAYRRRRDQRYRDAAALGRRIVAEIPTETDLAIFAEDASAFYYGETIIDKRTIRAVEVRVNGIPLAAAGSADAPEGTAGSSAILATQGGSHDRWDVAIRTMEGTVLVECGAIRDQVSQEIALRIYDAVKRSLTCGPQTSMRANRPLDRRADS
jgi:Tfp pilus assembly protein PilV